MCLVNNVVLTQERHFPDYVHKTLLVSLRREEIQCNKLVTFVSETSYEEQFKKVRQELMEVCNKYKNVNKLQ